MQAHLGQHQADMVVGKRLGTFEVKLRRKFHSYQLKGISSERSWTVQMGWCIWEDLNVESKPRPSLNNTTAARTVGH